VQQEYCFPLQSFYRYFLIAVLILIFQMFWYIITHQVVKASQVFSSSNIIFSIASIGGLPKTFQQSDSTSNYK
jgi:hypothetical protein